MKKIFIGTLIVSFLLCCTESGVVVTTEKALVSQENYSEGMYKSDRILAKAKHLPNEELVARDRALFDFPEDEIREKYEDGTYFLIEIAANQHYLMDVDEKRRLSTHLSFGLENDISLRANGVPYPPIIYHNEGTAELTGFNRIIVAFRTRLKEMNSWCLDMRMDDGEKITLTSVRATEY